MSKATNQALVQLSITAGCFNTLRENKAFSRVDIKYLVESGIIKTTQAVIDWPCTGEADKNNKWIKSRLLVWYKFLQKDTDNYYTDTVMIKMAERMITTLTEKIRDPVKLKLLQPIVDILKELSDFTDPKGIHFPAFEKSDQLLNKLYELIDMKEVI